MLAAKDKEAITHLAEQYRVSRLILFGSSADPTGEAHDIDLAVESLPAEDFFRFYGDLLFSVSKPVDLIDLSQDSKFTRLIRQSGPIVFRLHLIEKRPDLLAKPITGRYFAHNSVISFLPHSGQCDNCLS